MVILLVSLQPFASFAITVYETTQRPEAEQPGIGLLTPILSIVHVMAPVPPLFAEVIIPEQDPKQRGLVAVTVEEMGVGCPKVTTEVVEIQPLLSVKYTEYVPAQAFGNGSCVL